MNLRSKFMATALLAAGALPAAAGNDENNFNGDKLSFPVDVPALNRSGDALCIPAKTPLRGMGAGEVKETKGVFVRLANVFGTPKNCATGKAEEALPANTALLIAATDFKALQADRYGLTYGALVVPFKYHVNGSKEFRGDSTVGPYLGYRFDRNSLGFGSKLVGFLGASTVSVVQNVDGEERAQSLAGFSYGLGLIGQIKGDFQLGLVVGADRVSKSARYPDNGKMWIAVSLGFDFAR